MASPDPESFSFLSKVIAAGGAIAAPVYGFYRLFNGKADKKEVAHSFEKVEAELSIQRGHIGKVFDQIRENESAARDRHEKLLEAIYQRK